jgi:hypothetical protein
MIFLVIQPHGMSANVKLTTSGHAPRCEDFIHHILEMPSA